MNFKEEFTKEVQKYVKPQKFNYRRIAARLIIMMINGYWDIPNIKREIERLPQTKGIFSKYEWNLFEEYRKEFVALNNCRSKQEYEKQQNKLKKIREQVRNIGSSTDIGYLSTTQKKYAFMKLCGYKNGRRRKIEEDVIFILGRENYETIIKYLDLKKEINNIRRFCHDEEKASERIAKLKTEYEEYSKKVDEILGEDDSDNKKIEYRNKKSSRQYNNSNAKNRGRTTSRISQSEEEYHEQFYEWLKDSNSENKILRYENRELK